MHLGCLSNCRLSRFSLLVFFLVLGVAAIPAMAQESSTAESSAAKSLIELQREYRRLYQQVSPSVVAVTRTSIGNLGNQTAAGSLGGGSMGQAGFVINGGFVVTDGGFWGARESAADLNQTVSEALGSIGSLQIYTTDGRSYSCSVVGYDVRNLLLVLKLPEEANVQGLQFAESRDIPVGTHVMGFGNSFDSVLLDQQVSFSVGALCDRYKMEWRPHYSREGDAKRDQPGDPYRGYFIEFEGSINPGDYGGPIVDLNGKVIGLSTSHYYAGRHIGTAVPSSQFLPSFRAIVKEEALPEVERLGFGVTDNMQNHSKYGPGVREVPGNADTSFVKGRRVVEVDEGSLAEAAGLKLDDVIVKIDGQRVHYRDELARILSPDVIVERISVENAEGASIERKVTMTFGLPPSSYTDFLVFRKGQYMTLRIETSRGMDPLGRAKSQRFSGVAGELSARKAAIAAGISQSVVQVFVYGNDRDSAKIKSEGGAMPGRGRPDFFEDRIGPYSGVVVDSAGHILIADTALRGFYQKHESGGKASNLDVMVVIPGGKAYKAEIIGRYSDPDVALLKIEATELHPVSFRETRATVGEGLQVITRSFSAFLPGAADGVCSAEVRETGTAFQVDAHLGTNSLGGLVVDARGQPIGMVNQLDLPTYGQNSGIAYATHGDALVKFLKELKTGLFVAAKRKPFHGIVAAPEYPSEPGLRVTSVFPGAGAARAGVTPDDIILSADGRDLYSIEDLNQAAQARNIDEFMVLKIQRVDEEIELKVQLTSRD